MNVNKYIITVKSDKALLKKVIAGTLCLISVIMVLSTFLKSDNARIIGKWANEEEYKKYNAYTVMEFFTDHTCVRYTEGKDGDTWAEEKYDYDLNSNRIEFSQMGWWSDIDTYEFSNGKLILDGGLYIKIGGLNSDVFKYIVSKALFISAVILFGKINISPITAKVKKVVESIVKKATPIEPNPEITLTDKVEITPEERTEVKNEKTPASTEVGSRLRTTFNPKPEESIPTTSSASASEENKGDWFQSAGDL